MLEYLDFEYSEDAEGNGTWDAMASVNQQRWPALLHEVQLVLHWAYETFPSTLAPLDEGGDWDYALSAQNDTTGQNLHFEWNGTSGNLETNVPFPNTWTTLTLTLSGAPSFGQALRHMFELE